MIKDLILIKYHLVIINHLVVNKFWVKNNGSMDSHRLMSEKDDTGGVKRVHILGVVCLWSSHPHDWRVLLHEKHGTRSCQISQKLKLMSPIYFCWHSTPWFPPRVAAVSVECVLEEKLFSLNCRQLGRQKKCIRKSRVYLFMLVFN